MSARSIEIRVVAATNRDLAELVDGGGFRGDLLYRLSGGLVEVPPLRVRRGDILRLAKEFLQAARERTAAGPLELSDASSLACLRYHWPGNVRELKHAMEYVAAVVEMGEVVLEHLPAAVQKTARTAAVADLGHQVSDARHASTLPPVARTVTFAPIKERIDELVRTSMLDALQVTHWNVARSSRLLRMSRRTFIKKMKKYGLRDLQQG